MRILLALIAILFVSNVFANQRIECPTSLTCNYQAGTCNQPAGWSLDAQGAFVPFEGNKEITISSIKAYKNGQHATYQLTCEYEYTQDGANQAFRLMKFVNNLVGSNWSYTGFGNQRAICNLIPDSRDTSYCAGEN